MRNNNKLCEMDRAPEIQPLEVNTRLSSNKPKIWQRHSKSVPSVNVYHEVIGSYDLTGYHS